MADVPVYSVVSQRKYKTSVLKPKWAWSWQGNTTANEIARRFPVAGLPLVNSVLRFARQFVALSMLSRSHDQSCAENARFRKTVHRVEFFSCKRWLVRDLSEFTQQDGKMLVCDKPGRVITYVFCCDLHFKGK